jgi:chromosome segregation ATPase
MQDRAMVELQRQLKSSQAEVRSLKSEVSKLTAASHHEDKELAKKTAEITKLIQSMKDAEATLNKEKDETKKAREAEHKLKSEMIYKCSLLTAKAEKLQKVSMVILGRILHS